ncbi:MAG: protein kinase [Vicinamibacterales bacterium]
MKILPDAFADDPDRLARFQREAQVLASLNHPNIAAIYGIEKSDDTQALVLELVEGPTLADRIAKGPIPLDEALPIAKQIAEALEAAQPHDRRQLVSFGGQRRERPCLLRIRRQDHRLGSGVP